MNVPGKEIVPALVGPLLKAPAPPPALLFMELKDFDYSLPAELIAQYPLDRREASRLMVLDRSTGEMAHRVFSDMVEVLRSGDVLVLNDTEVLAARIRGRKPTGAAVELLLVEKRAGTREGREVWRCMARPSKGLKKGSEVFFEGGTGRRAEVMDVDGEGFRVCEFSGFSGPVTEAIGEVPLPPYIRRSVEDLDRERYQTVYASAPGAVAAPTAGLHFTTALLDEIKSKGVEVLRVTLHTGPGTFLPVRQENVRDHRLSGESYSINPADFDGIRTAKREGRRVIAVGTTTTSALEGSVSKGGIDAPELEGSTTLFIYPGFDFKVIDGLVTNFHLPRSTLIMLAAAFAGREKLMKAYEEAVKHKYRFYSYGDCMFIC